MISTRLLQYHFSIFLFLVIGCSHSKEQCELPEALEQVKLDAAERFQLAHYADGYILETTDSPDRTSTITLSRKELDCVGGVKIPVQRIISFSATHIYMLDTLQALKSIVGFSNVNYIANKNLHKQVSSGETVELGEFETADIEKILALKPDIIIISGTQQSNSKIEKLKQAGVSILENTEWLESHPLGRAEWILTFGALLDNMELAQSIYDGIRSNYNNLKSETKKSCKFIYGQPVGSTWYIPGKNSFIATILMDAGYAYPWSDNDKSGSIAVDLEIIFKNQLQDSIWIAPGYKNLESIKASDDRLASFSAVQGGKVYNYDGRTGHNGNTLYWEESVLRCDWLLHDFQSILEGKDENLYFFRRLQ